MRGAMLDQFKAAQESPFGGLETALEELNAGRKSSHWIWYIFPQLGGLGSSAMAQKYALRDLDEAIAYVRDDVLRARLLRATSAVAAQLRRGAALSELMGTRLDAMKLVSSLTLFERAAGDPRAQRTAPDLASLCALCTEVLSAAAAQGFPRCAFTLARVATE